MRHRHTLGVAQLECLSACIARAQAVCAPEGAREIGRAFETQPVRDLRDCPVREPYHFVGGFAQSTIADVSAEPTLVVEPALYRGALQFQRIHFARRR